MNTKGSNSILCASGSLRDVFRLGALLLAAISTLQAPSAYGQQLLTNRSCATFEVHQALLDTVPSYRTNRAMLQAFTAGYINDIGKLGAAGLRAGVVRIPVVVHVVYNTAAQNISDAQIASQITVLNADYRALNSDISSVPTAFAPLVGDARIQFALAVRDPNCNATTGITRTSTTRTSFTQNDAVKSAASGGHDAWPRDKYLNLWVCNLAGTLLGYAQFPGGPAATDGVVIDFECFGNSGTATAPFDLGRTATHEIGHWFNLNHIWGDDGCGPDFNVVCPGGSSCLGTDEVADTPNQELMRGGCPTFPQVSCGNGPNGDMFMNYMDYTDDACMFMFSQGQHERMDACLQAPAPAGRAEILGSDGLIPATGLPAGPDLWSQDKPDDPGTEPNTISAHMWQSDDIWVREIDDGIAHQDHQNPVYRPAGPANYVYVRVRNRSCGAGGSGTVKLYWAKASSALGWPAPFDGSVTTPALMGGSIGSQASGTVPAGGYVILKFPWNPPNPADYASFGADQSHFCLLSRIETSPSFPYGMTTAEGADLNANVRNNNNIVWKNVHVVTAGGGRFGATTIGNMGTNRSDNRLVFNIPAGERSVFQWGRVLVHFDDQLFRKWQDAGSVGFGIEVSQRVIRLLNPGAVISGIELDPRELHTIRVEFARFSGSPERNIVLSLILTQEEFRRDRYVTLGGMEFVLKDKFLPGVITPTFDPPGVLVLTWTPFGSGLYVVERADDLTFARWSPVPGEQWPITNTVWVATGIQMSTQGYYRVRSD